MLKFFMKSLQQLWVENKTHPKLKECIKMVKSQKCELVNLINNMYIHLVGRRFAKSRNI